MKSWGSGGVMTDKIDTSAARKDIVHRLRDPWFTNGCEAYQLEAADMIDALRAEVDRLRSGLLICQDELDEYSRQEYPSDHPVHEQYRRRDYDANPARVTLKGGDA